MDISRLESMMDRMLEAPENWRLLVTPQGNAVVTDNPRAKGLVIGSIYARPHWIVKTSRIVSDSILQSLDTLTNTKLFGFCFFLKQRKSLSKLKRVQKKQTFYSGIGNRNRHGFCDS